MRSTSEQHQDENLPAIEDAKRMLAILDERLEIAGSLSSTYVDGVAEMVKILWDSRFSF